MITVYCGENSISARTAYRAALDAYIAKGTEVREVSASALQEEYKGALQNMSLFSKSIIYSVYQLEKAGFRKSTKAKKDKLYETIVAISKDPHIILIDFEDGKQSRELKLKDLAEIKESKASATVFTLLEMCYPGNAHEFITTLKSLCESQDEMFLLIMLFRHVRQLVLISQKSDLSQLSPWQKAKLISQANKWDPVKLLDFYSGLIKVEINAKSNGDPYGIAKSIEILVCHYL